MKTWSQRMFRSMDNGGGNWRLVPVVVFAGVLLAPWLGLSGSPFSDTINIGLLTLIVSGLNLSFGYGGQFAVGQAAMYAIGAYTGAILAIHHHDLVFAVLAAGLAAALLGLFSGFFGLRLSGWGLGMVSFFLVLLVPDVVDIFKGTTGGLAGLTGVPPPALFGYQLTQRGFYLLVMIVAGLWVLIMRNIVVSRHGGAFLVMRESPVLAQSLGINVTRLKLLTYTLGAVPAGLAGALLAYLTGFVAPDYFSLTLTIGFIAASIIGGSQSVYGAVLGAVFLVEITSQSSSFSKYAYIAYGVMLVAGGVLLPGGIASLARAGLHRLARLGAITEEDLPVSPRAPSEMTPMAGKLLELEGVAKAFSGVRALRDVTLKAAPGSITALIGANGSGKTTTINIVSGFYRVDHGSVWIDGEALENKPAHVIARRGVARTFQTPIIPKTMTTLDVVAAARYQSAHTGILGAILRLPSFRRCTADDSREAHRILSLLGIDDLANKTAALLPLGSRRLVEVARVLADNPSVLLLDEPASGLDQAEVAQLSEVIRRVSQAGATVVLVEHNFEMVCDVADVIYVLEFGEVLASGTPAEIRSSEAVARSYLGQLPESAMTSAEQIPVAGREGLPR
jgi:branched-chain amino acid transport system ATP-binding protein/branched-chain amino acid transport system permease protein